MNFTLQKMQPRFTELKTSFYENYIVNEVMNDENYDQLCIEYCDSPNRAVGECGSGSDCRTCPFADEFVYDIESYFMEHKLKLLGL